MLRKVKIPIRRLTLKGNGLGEEQLANGTTRPVEVAFAIPGDTVQAQIYKKKSGKAKARLEEIIQPSPDRIEPRCIHFGSCGGCRLQQMPYEKQLHYKEEMVKQLFGDLLEEGIYQPIIPCDQPWQYRNKMEYSFSSNLAGEKFLGLVIDGTRGHVLNLKECFLVHPWFTQCLEAVRQWWESSGLQAYHLHKNTGTLRTLILRESATTGDRLVMLTVSSNPEYAPKRSHINSLVSTIRNAVEQHDGRGKLSIFVRIQQSVAGMPTNFYEMLVYGPDILREELTIQPHLNEPPKLFHFHVSPASFFQPNPRQAEKLYSRALQIAQVQPDEIVYDLYCGTGTIGICAAEKAKQVIGIEVSPEAALDAKTNVKLNKLSNVKVYAGAVHHVLEQVKKDNGDHEPDLVIIDPPRAGLESVGQRLLPQLNGKRILYISCNPASMVVDIRALQAAGYRLISLQPVDMFPQTMHVENIALLIRQ